MAPSVAPHGPGSSIVSTNGKFVLTPGGTANATFHAYLSTLGLPIGPGDVLVWSWSANAAMGPPDRVRHSLPCWRIPRIPQRHRRPREQLLERAGFERLCGPVDEPGPPIGA